MKRLALLAALLLPLSMAFAQQNVGFKTDKVEPLVINPDNSVTFYVEAPKAKSVSVKGDWEANEGNGQMTKGKPEYGAIRLPHCHPKCTPIV